jgi:hypothetical protein
VPAIYTVFRFLLSGLYVGFQKFALGLFFSLHK